MPLSFQGDELDEKIFHLEAFSDTLGLWRKSPGEHSRIERRAVRFRMEKRWQMIGRLMNE
jgi:hypothetical protein